MAFVIADRVQETTSAPGTGAATLLGAVTGYQTFASGIGANNTTYYVIADQSGANWEVGFGALNSTATALTRTTVYSSSNGGGTVNFVAGTQNVWCDYPAEVAVVQGGAVNFSSIGASTPGTGAFTTLAASGTVSGTGFSNYLASPPAIGSSVANTGSFTTLGASGTVSGAGFTAFMASPPAIGGTAAAAGTFTTLSATTSATLSPSGAVTINPTTAGAMDNMTVGGTTPAAGFFTQVTAVNGLVVNATTLTASYTIPAGYSAESVGGTTGFTIPSGMAVTVSSGSRWIIQ